MEPARLERDEAVLAEIDRLLETPLGEVPEVEPAAVASRGDVRQYDVSDPADPKLTGQVWVGGVIGKPTDARRDLNGGPNMLQLSFDGRRLYVTNSLYSTWDNQFYPELRSWLLRIDCAPNGGMEIDHDFFVDFHDRPGGPARTHEVRLQGGDCTTEIFQ